MTEQLTIEDAKKSMSNVPEWKIDEKRKIIYREYNMKDFTSAVRLIDKIAEIAEKNNHHPDIHLTNYRKLRVELSTHDAGGLTERDFQEAAQINALPAELK